MSNDYKKTGLERAQHANALQKPASDRARESVEKGAQIARSVGAMTRGLQRDDMLAIWQWLYMDMARALAEDNLSFTEKKNAAVAMSIATEKALILAGQPTQIIAGIHEHRHDLADIAAKLARVTKIIDGEATGAK